MSRRFILSYETFQFKMVEKHVIEVYNYFGSADGGDLCCLYCMTAVHLVNEMNLKVIAFRNVTDHKPSLCIRVR